MNKRLLNITELSQMIGIKTDTLYHWVSQKRVPYVKIGRLTKFDIEIIDRWIKRATVAAKDYV